MDVFTNPYLDKSQSASVKGAPGAYFAEGVSLHVAKPPNLGLASSVKWATDTCPTNPLSRVNKVQLLRMNILSMFSGKGM